LRSMVGLVPLFATALTGLGGEGGFENVLHSLTWLLHDRPDLAYIFDRARERSKDGRILAAFVRDGRLPLVLRWLFDESEFLSPYGIRALSKVHEREPYVLREGNAEFQVAYEPAESGSGLFGGNSNWRGPVWMPVNYLVVQSLRRMYEFHGDDLLVEFPTGSGTRMTLSQAADRISERLVSIFERDGNRRPVFGGAERFQDDPYWRDNVLFYEYFHGDNGAGLGASHQTGWTGLVANLICERSERSL
jgi:Glycosyl hydrolase family 63 C-terminal domain